MGNEEWEMEMIDDGRISEAPFVLPDYTPHSASLHVRFSTIYASPKRIRILRVSRMVLCRLAYLANSWSD